MNTSIYIAKRYLISKKSTHAIHIISGISMLGVFIGSAALIIILSVFNGFEDIILKMYNTIAPNITISPENGKTFISNNAKLTAIKNSPSVAYYVESLQENVVLKYNDKQSVALVKGVSSSFLKNKQLDSITIDGNFTLTRHQLPSAVLGIEIQTLLNINVNDPLNTISIYAPRKDSKFNSINPYDDFIISNISAAGVFNVDQFYNNQVFVPLAFAQKLFNDSTHLSSLEVFTKDGENMRKLQQEWQILLGNKFKIKNRFEQNQLLYQILVSEKWAIYLILTFILIVAIFNIIGSLTMLVIDKVKDIAILSSLGASQQLIRRIFLLEGLMISLLGCLFGLLIGGIFCLGQQKFGWIHMAGSSISEAFPIQIHGTDFLLIFATVITIAGIASYIASAISVKRLIHLKEDL